MKKIIGLAALARSGKDTVASILMARHNVSAFALADPLKAGCQVLFGLSEAQAWDDQIKEQEITLWRRSPRRLFQEIGTDWMRDHNPNFWLMRADREINLPFKPANETPENLSDPRLEIKLACQAFFAFSNDQIWEASASRSLDPFWNITPNKAFDLIEYLTLSSFPDWYFQRTLAETAAAPIRPNVLSPSDTIIIKDIRFENEADFIRKRNGAIWHIERPNSVRVSPHSSEAGIDKLAKDQVIINDGSIEDLEKKISETWKKTWDHD